MNQSHRQLNGFSGPLLDDYFPCAESLHSVYVDKVETRSSSSRRYYCVTAVVCSICVILGMIACSHDVFSRLLTYPFPALLRSNEAALRDEFSKFMKNNFRSYGSLEDEELRYSIFKANMYYINSHNVKKDSEFTLAQNQFMDMTREEWSKRYLSPWPKDWAENRVGREQLWSLALVANGSLPSDVNWVSRGCVSRIKDQGHCGSCWAFASTGAIEGAICAQKGVLFDLSEQQLVDCGFPEGSSGCRGGSMDAAFQYVIDAEGLCTGDEYPYLAKESKCGAKSCKHVARISRIVDIPAKNADALMAGVALHGPVAVGIEADRPAFQFYHKGVFNQACGKKLDHAVLVVGYGEDEITKKPYWLVKNSWGVKWGDSGFVKLARNIHTKSGECGILLAPALPIVGAN